MNTQTITIAFAIYGILGLLLGGFLLGAWILSMKSMAESERELDRQAERLRKMALEISEGEAK